MKTEIAIVDHLYEIWEGLEKNVVTRGMIVLDDEEYHKFQLAMEIGTLWVVVALLVDSEKNLTEMVVVVDADCEIKTWADRFVLAELSKANDSPSFVVAINLDFLEKVVKTSPDSWIRLIEDDMHYYYQAIGADPDKWETELRTYHSISTGWSGPPDSPYPFIELG